MLAKIAIFLKKIVDYTKSEYCILKYFRDAFYIANKNLKLLIPLMFFSIFMLLYLSLSSASNLSSIFIVLLLTLAIFSVFLSGWLYTIKLAILNYNGTETNKENENIFKQFSTGVGLNFVKFLIIIGIYSVAYTIVILLTCKLAYNVIGDIGITDTSFLLTQQTNETMKNAFLSLTPQQLHKLSLWYLCFFGSSIIYFFTLVFWIPEIICNETSVFKALGNSLKNLFKSFFKTLSIYSFLLLIYLLISTISVLYNHKIVNFIISLIYYYFVFYASIILLLFYKREFESDEQ